ncbi:MAG: hypothetical protein V1835_07255 [Candidatus Micrarchaeota archaeon]
MGNDYPVTPLTETDVDRMRFRLLSPRVRGNSLYGSPMHYGFAMGFLRQASRNTPVPFIYKADYQMRHGFFLVTTKGKGKGPIVLLSPVGNPEVMAPKIAEFARKLAERTCQPVIIKKADPLLERELIKYGFGDYRPGEEWDKRAPKDDDTYRNPVVFVDDIARPSMTLAKRIRKRENEFNNSIRKIFGKDAKVELNEYDPIKDRESGDVILHHWASEFALRKNEDPENAIAANEIFLRIRPDFSNLATYITRVKDIDKGLLKKHILKLENEISKLPSPEGNSQKLVQLGNLVALYTLGLGKGYVPIGFSTFERTGFVTHKSIEALNASLPSEVIALTKAQMALEAKKKKILIADLKKTAMNDLGSIINRDSKVRADRLTPLSALALTANIAIVPAVKQAGFMQLYASIRKLAEKKGKSISPVAMINLGGSENPEQHDFKMAFDPRFALRNWHLVMYPPTHKKERE